MIYSMTGYGESQFTYDGNTVKVELRALNGKTIDARIRIPQKYKSQELALRKLILSEMARGKIDFTVNITDLNNSKSSLNIDLIRQYVKDLKEIQQEEELSNSDILSAAFKIPNIFENEEEEASEEEVEKLFSATNEALKNIRNYRIIEGESMKIDLINRVETILDEHHKVDAFVEERNKSITQRIQSNLEKSPAKNNIDENRFEQEIIYYLDKLDINEEQVRLEQNCKYFLEIVNNSDHVKGKKLGFIAQEIGREINTLGSKAQHADIQRLVVLMKDELEKLKEQLANIM